MAQYGPGGGDDMAGFGDKDLPSFPLDNLQFGDPNSGDFGSDIFGQPTVLNTEDQGFLNRFWENPNDQSYANGPASQFTVDQTAELDTNNEFTFSGFNTGTQPLHDPPNPFLPYANNNLQMHSTHFHLPREMSTVDMPRKPTGPGDSEQQSAAETLYDMSGQGLATNPNDGNVHSNTWPSLHTTASSLMNFYRGTDQMSLPAQPMDYSAHDTQRTYGDLTHRDIDNTVSPPFVRSSNLRRQHEEDDWRRRRRQQQPQEPSQQGHGVSASQHDSFAFGTNVPRLISHEQRYQNYTQVFHPQSYHPRALVEYGSDPDFGKNGYSGPVRQQQGKENNLMDVPLAQQAASSQMPSVVYHNRDDLIQRNNSPAARPPQGSTRHTASAGPSTAASPNFSQGRISQDQQVLQTIENAIEGDNRAGSPRPRKRRRSQRDIEEDAEYAPPQLSELAPSPNSKPRTMKQAPARLINEVDETFAQPSAQPQIKKRRKSSIAIQPSPSNKAPRTLLRAAPSSSPALASSRKKSSDGKPRLNLSDIQKRDNHIKSEQRRRNVIKDNYADIETLVPALREGRAGLSKSDALFEAAKYIEQVDAGNMLIAEKLGVSFEAKRSESDNQEEDAEGGDVSAGGSDSEG